ncbi:hypothetical protein BO068_005029 [Escherichia coli]|nr:hypothetical protein [Escherichia coli]EFG8200262.1 hypothetical protein [Escherichia coli]
MNRVLAWVLPLTILAGCQTMTPEERRAADEQTCRDFGFRKKNDAFAACMQRLELDRRAQRRANQIEFAEFQRDARLYRRPVIVYQAAPRHH